MNPNNQSLQKLLVSQGVSLSSLCQHLGLDATQMADNHDEDPYGRLLTTLAEQQRLPELVQLLETTHPHIQWRGQTSGIFMNAQRDIELEIHGDFVGGDKITNTATADSGAAITGDNNIAIGQQGANVQGDVTNSAIVTGNYNHIIIGTVIDDIEKMPPDENGDSPYKGLDFFAEEDAAWYFGRDKLIATIVNRLHDTNFLAIVGDSGSGKSSLVRAGIIPAMKRNRELIDDVVPPRGNWQVYTLRPTARPMAKLADTFFPDASDEAAEQPTALTNALPKAQKTLLFIDQFEELFTQCKDEAKRQLFIANLLNAQSNSCKIILTIRADFYAQCLRYEQLRDVLETSQKPIGEMSNEELVEAILKPAEKGNWQFQAGLAEDMLEDVGREPGA
ncbi:MAG: ATP-binding protein, partial [Anaerolineales bacterium]|nr:ATP-binding protein [Anaerolineales bacterium]